MTGRIKKLWKIRLSGTGGQGLISASIILSEALILAGENVIQSQSYGAEARGGASKGEVIVSDGEERIFYPKIDDANLLLCLSREAMKKYLSSITDDALLVIDTTNIPKLPATTATVYAAPITKIARKEAGSEIAANIVALGVIAAVTDIVPKETLAKAIERKLPKRFLETNLKALEAGLQAGQELMAEAPEHE